MPHITIKPDPFYDRKLELAALDRAWKRHGAGGQMLLLYGRRRLGKTFLLQRYFTAGVDGNEYEKPHCYFLAEQSTAATQRLMLARQLIAALPSEGVSAEDIAVSWNALLRYASQQAKGRKKGVAGIRRNSIPFPAKGFYGIFYGIPTPSVGQPHNRISRRIEDIVSKFRFCWPGTRPEIFKTSTRFASA
jgi:hypothetical protein